MSLCPGRRHRSRASYSDIPPARGLLAILLRRTISGIPGVDGARGRDRARAGRMAATTHARKKMPTWPAPSSSLALGGPSFHRPLPRRSPIEGKVFGGDAGKVLQEPLAPLAGLPQLLHAFCQARLRELSHIGNLAIKTQRLRPPC
jgi:hypothetical protein